MIISVHALINYNNTIVMEELQGKFIGAWKLRSCTFIDDNGQKVDFMGKSPRGLLIYTASGTMSAQLMNSERARFSTEDWLVADPHEVKEAFISYQAYFGRYEIDTAKKAITHQVEASIFPNWHLDEASEVRYYQFEKELLILSTPPILINGEKRVFTAVWEPEVPAI